MVRVHPRLPPSLMYGNLRRELRLAAELGLSTVLSTVARSAKVDWQNHAKVAAGKAREASAGGQTIPDSFSMSDVTTMQAGLARRIEGPERPPQLLRS